MTIISSDLGFLTYKYDIINYLIKKHNYKTYLEIGVMKGDNIRAVQCETKDGIDPMPMCSEVTHSMTSDQFFMNHPYKKYDIIFIDGNHNSEFVCRDFNNAALALNYNGHILLHDCYPWEEYLTVKQEEYTSGLWCGDGYKVIYSIVQNYADHFESWVVDTDCGVGVIRKRHDEVPIVFYDDTYSWRDMKINPPKSINLISPEDFKDKI